MDNENKNNPHELNPQGFGLPENYFEKSTQFIQSKIELLDEKAKYPFLFGLRKLEVFSLPHNFFAESEMQIEKGFIKKLPYTDQTKLFSVPENYFEKNRHRTETILSRKNGVAKVIPLFRPQLVLTIAAVLTIVLGVWLFAVSSGPAAEDCNTLACLDKSELLQARDFDELDNEDLYGSVNTAKLQLSIHDQTTFDLDSEERMEQLNDDFIND